MKKETRSRGFRIPGFTTAGIFCGIKTNKQKDLALIFSEEPSVAAGVFTSNKVVSPTITWCQKSLKSSKTFRAILVNSGNANACTGPKGIEDCKSLASNFSKKLSIDPKEILIASTGVIGIPLPKNKIIKAIPALTEKLSPAGWVQSAEAIMTTDLSPKLKSSSFYIGKHKITMGGIAKGSGMIHPNMATMLAFIVTDAVIDKKTLSLALKEANHRTFNRITVDGDTSTNDMALLLANGKAENTNIRVGSSAYNKFVEKLTALCLYLAHKIVLDGEGATKFVTIKVQGAKVKTHAYRIAQSVATSTLVKTALFGQDPNWGRIFAAVGNAEAPFNPDKVRISLNSSVLFDNGVPAKGASQPVLRKKMKSKNISIIIDLKSGIHSDEVYTCDLSYDYVRINAEYTT
ncbi:MAG: bifunctional glutamate N-acetyltransferase/amino-acid acetyltransferase ArgJ [Nitrospina sp.]|nr:bifunctional glutamate N-acetyltransferase/amino-acid acetyltransferase ArgJ [Nitrospina sp.]MBT6601798.1 bifunctional glutamate N-acetyltransferase/amino-acid acetyltransferase ArgJ [Nitrospina sp.]